jgi:hypothetical protein
MRSFRELYEGVNHAVYVRTPGGLPFAGFQRVRVFLRPWRIRYSARHGSVMKLTSMQYIDTSHTADTL